MGAQGPFVSASIWPTGAAVPRPLAVVGAPPLLAAQPPATAGRFLAAATGKPTVSVLDLLGATDRRLGYAVTVPSPDAAYVVYGESALPKDRQAARRVELGVLRPRVRALPGSHSRRRQAARVEHRARRALEANGTRRRSCPYGNEHILLVVTPTKELGGTLLARLPWLLAIAGLVLTVAIALLVERLLRQRSRAEELAGELEQVAGGERPALHRAARHRAPPSSTASCPRTLPQIPGVDAAARYEAGVAGTDVGGDWYDVVAVGPDRLVFSVGDVCGRGLDAAATMAALRYSMRAYALEGNGPAEILRKLGCAARRGARRPVRDRDLRRARHRVPTR